MQTAEGGPSIVECSEKQLEFQALGKRAFSTPALPEEIPSVRLRGAHCASLARAMADGLNYSI
jgi:hypothetical protein